MKRLLVASTVFALLCAVPAPCRAARPLDTEDTGTLEPGTVEVELGADFMRSAADDTWATRVLLAVGIVPRLELRTELGALGLHPDHENARTGLADSIVALKWRIVDETAGIPAVLAALALRLPTGDSGRGLGADGVDVAPRAAVSKALGPVVLTGNVAYTFVTADRTQDFMTLATSVEYRPSEPWLIVAEAVGTLPSRAEDTLVLRAGAVHYVTPRVRLDGAAAVGLTRSSPDIIVTLGVTLGPF